MERRIILGGAPEGHDGALVAQELARGRPVIHLARDDKRAAAMEEALAMTAPEVPVLSFPAWDCVPYDRVSPNPDIVARRMATLATLARGVDGGFVLLTTLNAAGQRVPPAAFVRDNSFVIRAGHRVDEERLHAFLARTGFTPVPTVAEPGDYAVRGGIIDIYPPGAGGPVRLDLFGDEVESVRHFDPASQRTTERLTRAELAPMAEFALDAASIARFRRNYRTEFGAGGNDDPLYEAISAGRRHQGMEHWLPFFHETLETIFDYLPEATLVFDDRADAVRAVRDEAIRDAYAARKEALGARGPFESTYQPVPPARLYLDEGAWKDIETSRRTIRLSPLAQSPGPGVLDAGGRIGRDFAAERHQGNAILFKALSEHIDALRQDADVVLASWSEGALERLGGLLRDHDLAPVRAATLRDRPARKGRGGVFQLVWPLEHGFTAPGLAVISEQDIFGQRLISAPARRRKAEDFISDIDALSPGDLVVHVEHGIGRYRGIETITALGAPHACIALEYAEEARLYLPVENIELLSRFGHEEGLLDKLGGVAWQARKARLKERIREIAERLMRVAAERELRSAPRIEVPDNSWDAFCARFPWVETDDQLAAIADVMEDLHRGRPMDRLIVGDVGFGKTEVAMRAAFVAAMSGLQVAIVCPTTLLARQHFATFRDRFRGFPVNIRALSRFVPAKEAAATRAGLADGSVDIVVGTHALLAKRVRFQRLGLLIVDEEQHFGVSHKERLKEMRSEVHVLTLTATPIPRTLQLALSGVRDLSVIATPPIDRLAIRTYVSEFDAITVRDALLREHHRGGQSFYVVPRVADIPEIEKFLTEHVPEISFVVGHGQLSPTELDQRMNAFYDGRFDVLLATSIVESGLDIPAANTMIIHRADMFGLGQLYQMRGRVGRAKIRAYCYLTTRPRTKLTPAAERRLRILGALDGLGAGFNLASHDLDLRGAGNLLGEEQSGHIREVGYELYQHMLEETVSRIRAGDIDGPASVADDWSPQLNLGVPVLIPEDYIPDLDVRLGLYRRLSTLSTKVELEGFAAELIDRFGPIPREINILLRVVRIKTMARRAGVQRLDAGPKGATIEFHDDKFANPAGLVEFLQAQGPAARVRGNRIVLEGEMKSEDARLRAAMLIVRQLAEKAAAAA